MAVASRSAVQRSALAVALGAAAPAGRPRSPCAPAPPAAGAGRCAPGRPGRADRAADRPAAAQGRPRWRLPAGHRPPPAAGRRRRRAGPPTPPAGWRPRCAPGWPASGSAPRPRGCGSAAGTLWASASVGLAQVAQQHALDPLQAVVAHVVVEAAEALEHLAGHRLGGDVLAAHPGVAVGEVVEGVVDEVAVGLGPLELSSSSMRCSYSTPSAFSRVDGLVLEREPAGPSAPGAGSPGSPRPATARRAGRSRAPGSSIASVSTRYSDSVWCSEKSCCSEGCGDRVGVARALVARAARSGPARRRVRKACGGGALGRRLLTAALVAGGDQLEQPPVAAAPARDRRCSPCSSASSRPWLTAKRDSSGSGVPPTRRSKVPLSQCT